MKRILPVFLALCLLFCGCQPQAPESTEPATEPTQAPTEPATEPTQAPTEPPDTGGNETPIEETTAPITESATEPAEPQDKVTVYLVERTAFYDSGYVTYNYDENFNIVSYDVYSIENELMYSTVFSEHNTHGMPCKFSQHGGNWTIAWFEDGKIKEEQEEDNYSGYQYEYDQKGDIIEKRGYYEGILQDTVYYEYNGDELFRVYCEDVEGNHTYDCRVENGVIIEKVYYDPAASYSYFYEYDENGNWIAESFLYDGELTPSSVHSYVAVEVDADRATYLLEQQKYIVYIT